MASQKIRWDKSQRQALEHRDGGLVVLGGPGTGKTLLAGERVAALIEAGVAPGRILVLAPGAAAAQRLRSALDERLTQPFEEPWIYPIDGFALRLLREEAAEAGLDPFFEPLGPSERLAMLLDRAETLRLRHHEIRGDPARLLGGIVARIDRLKAQGVSAAELERRAAAAQGEAAGEADVAVAAREREFAELYAEHDRIVRAAGGLDHGDLAMEALRLLRAKPDLRLRRLERFEHILVDDFDLLTPVQQTLVEELMSEKAAMWLSTQTRFEQALNGAEVIELERSYRCGSDALDAAAAAVAGDAEDPTLRSPAPARGATRVRFWRCANQRAQAQALAAEIEAALDAGEVAPDAICVLVGSARGEGRMVTAALEERGVGFHMTGSAAFFGRPEVRDVVAWLRLLADPSDAGAVVRALTRPPVELRSIDLARCTTIARRRKLDMVSALQAALESPQLPPEARERIDTFCRLHKAAASAFDEMRPDVFVRRLIERIGLRRAQLFAAQPETVERLVNVARLGELAASWARREPDGSTREFARYLAAVAESGGEIGDAGPRGPAVRVMSFAGSAGLEFERVYVLGLHAGAPTGTGGSSGAGEPGKSGRRAPHLYVAMTRARRELILAWPEQVEGAAVRPAPAYEAARTVLGAQEEVKEEELFGPGEGLHSTFRMMRDELLETVSRVGGNLGELRLDTYMDVNRAVARYLELVKLSALIQRPADQSLADALASVNELLGQVATPEQAEALAGSALDAYVLDAQRDEARRRLVVASRAEPSLEAFIPRRGEGLMLSAGDIETYLTCPLKYKFRRVFTIPQEPTINQRFGIVIHQVLERFHQAELGGRAAGAGGAAAEGELGAGNGLGRLLALFNSSWRRAGFGSSDDELQFRDKAVAALARYHERHQAEQSRPVWFERGFAFRVGPHHLRGRVDRVDRLPDGGYELIDYKTGRSKQPEELREDIQLSLYGLGARRAWQVEPEAQSYYYVLEDRKLAVESSPGDEIRVEATVLEVGEGVMGQDFEPNPSLERCGWCDYKLICPAAEL